jgi:hypothetical protein
MWGWFAIAFPSVVVVVTLLVRVRLARRSLGGPVRATRACQVLLLSRRLPAAAAPVRLVRDAL